MVVYKIYIGLWAFELPNYTLGDLYAAQLLETMSEQLGDIDEIIESGDWSSLIRLVEAKIHQQGSKWSPSDLILHATGKNPTPQPFIDYIESKYSQLYNLVDYSSIFCFLPTRLSSLAVSSLIASIKSLVLSALLSVPKEILVMLSLHLQASSVLAKMSSHTSVCFNTTPKGSNNKPQNRL